MAKLVFPGLFESLAVSLSLLQPFVFISRILSVYLERLGQQLVEQVLANPIQYESPLNDPYFEGTGLMPQADIFLTPFRCC
jgi:hypothetical protein